VDRYDMFPHIEERLTMTAREWLMFHWTMHRHNSMYRGRHLLKTPMDLLVLRDIIADTRPEVVIEIGSFDGGSALWIADQLEIEKNPARVIGVDVSPRCTAVADSRIDWVIGDCTDPKVVDEVRRLAEHRRGLVIEDSDHKLETTRRILQLYESFVAVGSYFIVEDTIVEFIDMPPFPGPLAAVREFVERRSAAFRIDRSREKYLLTHNPMGYLARTAE